MNKIAQKQGLKNWYERMKDVPFRSAENFFKPELKRVMARLAEVDDVVRSTLSGSKIGKASPEDATSAKNLLKEAKSFINRREYMSAVASLGRFHKKMFDVAQVLKALDLDVNKIHHQFLFNKLPNKHREQLEEMRSRFATGSPEYFIKEAGIVDFLRNIGTQRGRALSAWEKRYPKIAAKIRDGASMQLESAQSVLTDSLELLKEMGSNRATSNIDAYLANAKQLINVINKYDTGKNGFRNYYNDVIKPYLDAQAKIEAEEAQEQSTSNAAKSVQNMLVDQSGKNLAEEAAAPSSTRIVVDPSIDPDVEISGNAPTSLPRPPAIPNNFPLPRFNPTVPPSVPSLPHPAVNAPIPEKYKSDEVAEDLFGPKKDAYTAFLDSLEVFGNENPIVLASHISKYAKSIQADQPATAIKLFKIAKSLRG
jgi:hypothetical protein